MIRVLVTGASGFVGRAACSAMVSRGYQLRAATRSDTIAEETLGDGESVSIRDLGPTTDWGLALLKVDVVLHLAARAHIMHVGRREAEEFRRVNTEGTIALARQAHAAGVRRFVFVSSIKVYGESTSSRPFSHDTTPAPADVYARSKLAAEDGLREIRGLETVIVRPPLVYGKGVKGNFARLCELVRLGIPLPFGRIQNRRDLLGLDNLVDLLTCCLEHPAAAGQTFVAADGFPISTPDLCVAIAKEMGKRARIFPVPVSLLGFLSRSIGRAEEADRLVQSLEIDSSHVQRTLQWHPPCTLQEGIARMVEQFLKSRGRVPRSGPVKG